MIDNIIVSSFSFFFILVIHLQQVVHHIIFILIMDAVIAQIASAKPELEADAKALLDFSERKVYHQLTEAVFKMLPQLPGALAKELYEKTLKPVATKCAPIRYMEVVRLVSQVSITNNADKLKFLEDNFAPFDTQKENKSFQRQVSSSEMDYADCRALFLASKAEFQCEMDQTEACKDILDELEKDVFVNRGPEKNPPSSQIFSWFYRAQCKLFVKVQSPSAFFKAGMNYLRFTPLDKVEEKEHLAMFLAVSALIAPGEFYFGECLELELWKVVLQESKNKGLLWLHQFLVAFREGKYELFDDCIKSRPSTFPGFKQIEDSLQNNEVLIRSKFSSCVLMEHAFQQPKKSRRLSLKSLKDKCRVDDVEKLLITSMCANLIRGSIDEVDQVFIFTWVKPRFLDASRIKVLADRIGSWIAESETVLTQVDELTPELLVN